MLIAFYLTISVMVFGIPAYEIPKIIKEDKEYQKVCYNVETESFQQRPCPNKK